MSPLASTMLFATTWTGLPVLGVDQPESGGTQMDGSSAALHPYVIKMAGKAHSATLMREWCTELAQLAMSAFHPLRSLAHSSGKTWLSEYFAIISSRLPSSAM